MTSSEYSDMTGAFPVAPQPQPGAHLFPPPPPAQVSVANPYAPDGGQHPMAAPPADPYAVQGWSSPYEDFVAPSGQRCRLKKLDLPDLIQAGLLDKMDALSGIVGNDLVRPAQGQPPADTKKILKNPRMMAEFGPILDRVVMLVVDRPVLHEKPGEGEERVPGRAYLDAISLIDKVAIFSRAAGDLEDLKSFRAEPDKSA